MTLETAIKLISIITAVIAGIWGIYVFNTQQKYKRLQNLAQILQRFADKKEFMNIFTLFDQSLSSIDSSGHVKYDSEFLEKVKSESVESKLQFLVLLEEVVLYATSFEVDRTYAVHLFQWHFYYVFREPEISKAFWSSLGGIEEIKKPYWKFQRDFSKYCNPVTQ